MPTDMGPKLGGPTRAAPSPSALSAGRLDKPLGRGLEDIASVFLSHVPEEAVVRESARTPPPPLAPPRSGAAGSILLRPHGGFTRDQLSAALIEFAGALEEGLRRIDTNLPCDLCGDIDILAVDREHQLTIIDFDTTPDERLLLRGIAHFDWVVRNIANLRRMYQGQVVNFSLEPRLFLVGPQFSRLLTIAARQITRPRTSCVRYHVVDVLGGTGLLFEHVEDRAV